MQFVFNANEFEPSFGAGNKLMPANKLLVAIENSGWVETKNHDGEYIAAEIVALEGPQKGTGIIARYNLHNLSTQAMEIAQKQLSGLCHCVGVYNLSAPDGAPPLMMMHGKPFRVDIGWQAGSEPTPEKPEGGYTEIKAFYDANGERPGQPTGGSSAPMSARSAPMAAPPPPTSPTPNTWAQQASTADPGAKSPPWAKR